MAGHRTHHNPLEQDTLFTTPASFMLDARLTPLERNRCRALRRASPLANLGKLRRYLTSTPLGQSARVRDDLACSRRASAYRLVGQHRAPLNGHVLSELYQVHESALSFQRACPLDACLPALLQSSIGQKNNLVDRVAVHIQATQVQAPEAASIATHGQRRDDDDLLLHRRIRPDPCSSHDPG